MESFIHFFVKRSKLVNLLTVFILLSGLISVVLIKKDSFPHVVFDFVVISTPYQGATPQEIEKFVSIPIERKLRQLSGIEEINSLSSEGLSVVNVKVLPGEDVDKISNDIKNAVDEIDDFPDEVEKPKVKTLDHRTRDVLKIALYGEDLSKLRVHARELRDHLEEEVRQLAQVNISGDPGPEFKVKIDLDKLRSQKMAPSEVAEKIMRGNINLGSGSVQVDKEIIFLRVGASFDDVESLKNLVVRSNITGEKLRLKDVAQVEEGLGKEITYHRLEGKRAIFLELKKKFNADIISTVSNVLEILEDYPLFKENTKLQYKIIDDISFYVKRRLGILINNGLIGLMLVFLCLVFFLDARTSLMTTISAPLAFALAFMCMDALHISLNLISLFGLILVLGMLVDDSIIVAEYFYQCREKGMNPERAAVEAGAKTFLPVLTTILTTILAFGSLLFMGGIMGKFIWQIPAIVIICLIASLFECFFILPAHLKDFSAKKFVKGKSKNRTKYFFNLYKRFLKSALKNYGWVVGAFGVLLIFSFWVAKNSRFELFPSDDARIIILNVKGKVGATLDETDRVMKSVEKVVQEKIYPAELEAMRTFVGMQMERNRGKRGDHYGAMLIYLTLANERERSTDELNVLLSKSLEKIHPDYTKRFEVMAGGPPKGKPLEIELTSHKIDELLGASKKVKTFVDSIDGVTSTEIDFEEGKKEFLVSIDEFESKRLQVNNIQVARELRYAFGEDSLTEIRRSLEDVDIVLYTNTGKGNLRKKLEQIEVLNAQGKIVPLSKIASIQMQNSPFVIRRLDGKRIISVLGILDRSKLTPYMIAKKVRPKLKEIISQYEGMKYKMGGENKDTQESMFRLGKMALISLGLIYVTLVAMFSSYMIPVVIMSAIPLGLIGVILSFKFLGITFGFMALLGIVGLIGVIVNDSIVLVNFIELTRQKHKTLSNAVYRGAISRFRAVALTTITTVLGLWPVAGLWPFTNPEKIDPFLRPMAMSFVFGLIFATLVTLVFVPCCYLLFHKVYFWGRGLWSRRFS